MLMKFSLLVLCLILSSATFAATWECVDSDDGHVYRVSQDVLSDKCRKVSNLDSYSGPAPEVRKYDHPSTFIRPADLDVAHSDSYCVKVGSLTASVARMLALGQSEEHILAMNRSHLKDKSKNTAQRRQDEITQNILDNMVAYVFTVKLPPDSARLVGYKKCLSGDFD